MKSSLLIAEYLSTPWALMPDTMRAFSMILKRWQAGGSASGETMANIQAAKEARAARQNANIKAGGGNIAVLPLYGVVTQRGNMLDDLSGGGSVSTQQFTQAFREAMADETIGQVLIDISSPGGSVYGVGELAAEIFQSRNVKPIVAISNSLAASAAYWIGSACGEFYCTPGGEVGSIGVWQAHEDHSKALTDEGVAVTLISAGKYKTEGNPYGPLDDDAMAFMQQRVNDYYQAFTQGVAQARGVDISAVTGGMGQGRVLGAAEAKSLNMIDDVLTFDQVVSMMQARAAKPAASGASKRQRAERELELANL